MHSTGENVQCTPVAATSTAVARATRSTRSASQVAAMPSWVGKIVAPSWKEWPWMQSSATSSGMRRRVRAVSAWARSTRSGEVCRIEPACLRSTWSSRSSRASNCIICPTFSGRVMRPSRSATRSGIGRAGSRKGGVSSTWFSVVR
nr:hypothetical protein [Saccharothrix syringae]